MDPTTAFQNECNARIEANGLSQDLAKARDAFLHETIRARYSYNFSWLGRPIIQYPQDVLAVQEIIWRVRPDLVIETGVAHGGSLILSASMLAMLDYADAVAAGIPLDPKATRRRVLGIDIDIRPHNRAAISEHALAHRIDLIEGSSVAQDVIARVRQMAAGHQRVLVLLDSNHTHDHVLAELEAYAPMTSVGSYCIVFDTVVEVLPSGATGPRPWEPGNNPMTAVRAYLARLQSKTGSAADGAQPEFEVDRSIDNQLLLSVAPEGYLRRTA